MFPFGGFFLYYCFQISCLNNRSMSSVTVSSACPSPVEWKTLFIAVFSSYFSIFVFCFVFLSDIAVLYITCTMHYDDWKINSNSNCEGRRYCGNENLSFQWEKNEMCCTCHLRVKTLLEYYWLGKWLNTVECRHTVMLHVAGSREACVQVNTIATKVNTVCN